MAIQEGQKADPVLTGVASVAVMSDLHLGASNCVLAEPGQIARLGAFLKANNVAVDALVLNGDMCDFALATMHDTVTHAREFLVAMGEHCSQMVYVPGNHDHHSWLLANELDEFVSKLPANVGVDAAQRTERMYHGSFAQQLSDKPLAVAYPNLYWKPPGRPDYTYIFSHGHFCEDTYSIVSEMLTDAFPDVAKPDLEFIEAANFGWIEFIWYSLGQAGKGLGANGVIGKLYDEILSNGPGIMTGGLQKLYAAKFAPIIRHALRESANQEWWAPGVAADNVADWIDGHAPDLIAQLIKSYSDHQVDVLQPFASPLRYRPLDGQLAQHCFTYLDRTRTSPFVPRTDQIALFFGHTHQSGLWMEPNKPWLFNDGGWIRHPKGEWPDAHILVIDSSGVVKDLYFDEVDAKCQVVTWEQTRP